MAVDMGTVWDRTTEFLSDNFGTVAPVFVAAMWLPQALSSLLGDMASTNPSPLLSLFVLLLVVPGIWAGLAVAANAIDPDAGGAAARKTATRSLGWGVLIVVVIGAVQFALLLPAGIALAAGGLDLQAVAAGRMEAAMATVGSGTRVFVVLYGLAWLIVALLINARTILSFPALVAEHCNIAAIGRSVRLTRGIVWKTIGVYLLFFIVLAVASMAVKSASGAIFGLLLPGEGPFGVGSIISAILAGLVSAIGALIIAAFWGKLYRAVTGTTGAPVAMGAAPAA